MKLKTIWEITTKSIKNNKVSFILLLTVAIGLSLDWIDWPDGKVSWHDSPASYSWFAYFVAHYIMGILILICIALPKSEIDKYVLYSYIVFDTYSMYSYIMYGWPEPKNDIIFGFCLVVLFLIGRLMYLNGRT